MGLALRRVQESFTMSYHKLHNTVEAVKWLG